MLSKNNESGATMLEFAVVLPILIVFILGIIQYGLIFASQLVLLNTTATAARYSTVGEPRPSYDEVSAFVNLSMYSPLTVDRIKSIGLIEDAGGLDEVREVTVKYNLELFFPWIVPQNTDGILELTATAITR